MFVSSFRHRDEPASLLAVRPQLPPGVSAAEGLHPGGHLQTGGVSLEAGAGEASVMIRDAEPEALDTSAGLL